MEAAEIGSTHPCTGGRCSFLRTVLLSGLVRVSRLARVYCRVEPGIPPLSPVFSFLPLFFLFASSARLVILSSHEEPDRGDRAWEPRVRPIIRSINPLPTFAAGRCTRCLANRNFRGIVFACARARAGKISLASNDKDDRFPALGNGRDSGVLGNFFSLFLFPRT